MKSEVNNIQFVDLGHLVNQVRKQNQELLTMQCDIHFEESPYLNNVYELLRSDWIGLIEFVQSNELDIQYFGKPNLATHPKELAVFLEVVGAMKEIFALFEDLGTLKSDYKTQMFISDSQLEGLICEQYIKAGLISKEFAPFAKWGKIAEKERISSEYVNLNLSITHGISDKHYLFKNENS